MDIVLLPRLGSAGTNSVPDHRFPFLKELFRRFGETAEAVRLFAYLPHSTLAERNELLRFLIESQRDLGIPAALIIRGNLLSCGILEHPYLPVLNQVILDMEEEVGAQRVAAVDAYVRKQPEHRRPLTLWTDFGLNGTRSRRLANLYRLGGIVQNLHIPDFRLGTQSAEPPCERSETPAEWIADFPPCQLYENSLTIDGDGRILTCPRNHGAATPPDLGNLATESLEAILIKKGRVARTLSSVERCHDCRLKARLYWPESRSEYSLGLMSADAEDLNLSSVESFDWMLAMRRDLTDVSDMDFDRVLKDFEQRLHRWADAAAAAETPAIKTRMVSVETPVIKVGWLLPCIESVLNQTSNLWHFSLLWDKGDERSRQVLEVLERFDHPRISVYFGEGIGVARARRFLTERSTGEYILPLDDDDLLSPDAVKCFLGEAAAKPWSGIIRARRDFIDEAGAPVYMQDWFPFGPRQYHRGMTCDMYNHSQPYLVWRKAYDKTVGWAGFQEYRFAGEDCDMFAKIEEVAEIELLDAVLYSYRLSGRRTSHELGTDAADDMWHRLALNTLERRGLPLQLTNAVQPFTFLPSCSARTGVGDVDLLVFSARPECERDFRQEWSSLTGISADAIHVPGADETLDSAIFSVLSKSVRRYVVLMRDSPSPGAREAIEALIPALQDYDADLAGPKILNHSDQLVSADPYFDSDLMPAISGSYEPDDGRFDYVSHTAWLPSTLLLVRRHVFRSIAPPDPELTGCLQDADFCLRARSRGFHCLYVGDVEIRVPDSDDAPAEMDARHRFQDRWARSPELLYPEQVIPPMRCGTGHTA